MRARTYKAAHHLEDSKRSIVLTCAGIALIMGTTSVGSSMFIASSPMHIERSNPVVVVDEANPNEVAFEEPTTRLLQGHTRVAPRKVESQPTKSIISAAAKAIEMGPAVASALINQLQPTTSTPAADQTAGTTAPGDTSGDTASGSTGGTAGNNPSTTQPDPVANEPADPNDPTTDPVGGGNSGDIEIDPDEGDGTSGSQSEIIIDDESSNT